MAVKVDPAWSRMGAARDSSFVRLAQRLAREGRSVRLALLRTGEVVVYASREADPNRVISLTDVSVLGQTSRFGARLQDMVERAPPESLHGPTLASASATRRAAGGLVLHTPLPILACQLIEVRERGSGVELLWNLLPSSSATEPVGRLKVVGKQDTLRSATLEWLLARPLTGPIVVPAQESADDDRTLQQLFDEAVEEASHETQPGASSLNATSRPSAWDVRRPAYARRSTP